VTERDEKDRAIEDLRREIRALKEELARIREERREGTASIGEAVNAFVSSLLREIAESITREMSVAISPRRILVHAEHKAEAPEGVPAEEAERIISPLAHAERIRILQALRGGGKYAADLARITGLESGPLHFHLKILMDAGYILQERERGRYLITMPGRIALKLVEYLYRQLSRFKE